MQAQIAASLRHLKEAAAHLSEAAGSIGEADKIAAANIEHMSLDAIRRIVGRLIDPRRDRQRKLALQKPGLTASTAIPHRQ